MADATSPMVLSSGMPPASRTLALLSAELPLPSRKWRLGDMVAIPLYANLVAMALEASSHPGM